MVIVGYIHLSFHLSTITVGNLSGSKNNMYFHTKKTLVIDTI